MRIRRIHVPEFRALKNIDISFEKDLSPQIFPLGSLNGGGKSTLLQLVFTLLHCGLNPNREDFITSILKRVAYSKMLNESIVLVEIEGEHLEDQFRLTYKIFSSSYLRQEISKIIVSQDHSVFEEEQDNFPFSMIKYEYRERLSSDIQIWERFRDEISELDNALLDISNHEGVEDKIHITQHYIKNNIKSSSIISREKNILGQFFPSFPFLLENTFAWYSLEQKYKPDFELNFDVLVEEIKLGFNQIEEKINYLSKKYESLERMADTFLQYLNTQNMVHLLTYSPGQDQEQENAEYILVCKVDASNDVMLPDKLLEQLSSKIFLAAPSTQAFLFLDKEDQKLLLRQSFSKEQLENGLPENYQDKLQRAKLNMPGLFTYDFLAVDLIMNSFKSSLKRDQESAILNRGQHGNNTQDLFDEIDQMLGGNKQFNLDLDFSSVSFKLLNGTAEPQQLYPEDLSHGELKQFSIYMWLKHSGIEDAVVLMDELEIAFHPDWQYRIVSDLEEWGPTNQYILATHSYEICQAVTPAHVKEITPKLLPDQQID